MLRLLESGYFWLLGRDSILILSSLAGDVVSCSLNPVYYVR